MIPHGVVALGQISPTDLNILANGRRVRTVKFHNAPPDESLRMWPFEQLKFQLRSVKVDRGIEILLQQRGFAGSAVDYVPCRGWRQSYKEGSTVKSGTRSFLRQRGHQHGGEQTGSRTYVRVDTGSASPPTTVGAARDGRAATAGPFELGGRWC